MRLLLSPCRRRQPSVLKRTAVLAWLKIPSLNITIVTSQHPAYGCLLFRGKCYCRFWKGCFSPSRNIKFPRFLLGFSFVGLFPCYLISLTDFFFSRSPFFLFWKPDFAAAAIILFRTGPRFGKQFLSFFCNELTLNHLFGKKPCSYPQCGEGPALSPCRREGPTPDAETLISIQTAPCSALFSLVADGLWIQDLRDAGTWRQEISWSLCCLRK